MHLAHTTTYKLLATSQKLPQNNPSCGSDSPELLPLCVSHTQGSPPPVREQHRTAPQRNCVGVGCFHTSSTRAGKVCPSSGVVALILQSQHTPVLLGANHTLSTTLSPYTAEPGSTTAGWLLLHVRCRLATLNLNRGLCLAAQVPLLLPAHWLQHDAARQMRGPSPLQLLLVATRARFTRPTCHPAATPCTWSLRCGRC